MDLIIEAHDGRPLAATLYTPARPSGPAVIINSATAVPRGFYAPFASFLAEHGLPVLTWDYRGIGGSRAGADEDRRARMHQWGELDLRGVLDWALDELGPAPTVIGHSAGGQIVGLTKRSERIGALMLIGAQSGDSRLWPGAQRWKMAALWYAVIPLLSKLLGRVPGALIGGEPLPGGIASEWASWGRRPGYLVGEPDRWRRAGFARVRAPLLAYSFSDDRLAPPAAVDALVSLYSGAAVTRVHWAPSELGARAIGHFGFFRPAHRDQLWLTALDWIVSSNRGGHLRAA